MAKSPAAHLSFSSPLPLPATQPAPAPHLLVFGGNGFVGSRVCERALASGLGVVSVSRSGAPPTRAGGGGPGAPAAPPAWAADVEWLAADAADTAAWAGALDGCVGVVSTLGAFGSNAHMRAVCGDANVAVFEAAAAAGVPRATFISVHPFGFPAFVLPGYFQGKAAAEEALFRLFPTGGVALRPGFIHGTRHVGGAGLGLPLSAVGAPLEAALGALGPAAGKALASIPLAGAAFVPPVSVDAVARAAVAAATDPAVPGGPMSVWEIRDRYGGGGGV